MSRANMRTNLPNPSRAAGLDTLRAAAIVLVFAYHYQVFVSGESTFGWLSQIGWSGVDLFFVLSGYLIGNQVMAALAGQRRLDLKTFYLRRLLRTLPNYYLVLALFFLFPSVMGGKTPPPLWTFLTFTQNIGLQVGTAFSHAWSLCIEEQFYLLLPPIALVVARLARSIRLGWAILIGLLLAGVVARWLLWQRYGGGGFVDYYRYIYYSSFGRMDELLPGVALAMLRNFHPQAWQALMQRGRLSLLAGLFGFVAVSYLFLQHHELAGGGFAFFSTVFGYPLLAGSFALLTAAALSPATPLARWRLPGAAQLAAWSYAIYLTHKPIGMLLLAPLAQLGIAATSWRAVLIVTSLSVLGGWLLYQLVETPFMRLRERFVPVPPGPAISSMPPHTAAALGR